MRRFLAGVALGGVASLSVSIGLIVTIVVFVLVVLVGVALRSFAVLSGGIIGWGTLWTVFSYFSFARSMCNGPGCDQGESALPFLAVALAILITGLIVGLIGLLRSRVRARRAA